MITVKQMYKIDKDAQDKGIPALILMENAGRNAAQITHKIYNIKDKNITIFAGTGNNGGDGLVYARHAQRLGAHVTVIQIKPPEHIRTEETKTNYNIIKNLKINIIKETPKDTDIAIDAILGTGLKDKIKEPYKTMIKIFNNLNCTKISLDCPTGIDADTGKTHGSAIKPDMTITFHDQKTGLNQKNSGRIIITDIGIKNGDE